MSRNGVDVKFTDSKGRNGFKAVTKKLQEINKQSKQLSEDIIKEATIAIHEDAVKSIATQSGGHQVTRYEPKRQVTAAKEGEAPNSDTGRLIGSIDFNFQKTIKGIIAAVGTNLKYGAWLEFGTKLMGARPWLWPAYVLHRSKIIKNFNVSMVNMVKKIGNK